MEHTVINTVDGTKSERGAGGAVKHVQWQSCHSETPRQAGEMNQQRPCQIDQGEVPSPAPGWWSLCKETGDRPAGQGQTSGKGLSEQQAEPKPAMHLHSKGGQQHPQLHEQERGQQISQKGLSPPTQHSLDCIFILCAVLPHSAI